MFGGINIHYRAISSGFLTHSHLSFISNGPIFPRKNQDLTVPTPHGPLFLSPSRWCPSSLAKLVNITPITMVYGRYNCSIHGVKLNQHSHHVWGHHPVGGSCHWFGIWGYEHVSSGNSTAISGS